MSFGQCSQCDREFWRDPRAPVGWIGSIDWNTGVIQEANRDLCADCWYRGWHSNPWPTGTGNPDWSPRPKNSEPTAQD